MKCIVQTALVSALDFPMALASASAMSFRYRYRYRCRWGLESAWLLASVLVLVLVLRLDLPGSVRHQPPELHPDLESALDSNSKYQRRR